MQNIDIIFCRNVIIYFHSQTIQRVIERFHNCLAQDGYLFLGHTETLWQITNKFERVEFPQTFIYKKTLSSVQEDATKPFMAVPEINAENMTLSAAPTGGFEAELRNRCSGPTLSGPPPSGWGAEGLISIKETGTEERIIPQGLRSGLQEKPEPREEIEKPPEVIGKVESAASPNHMP
jgi:hypothetical protein